jgi:hypothetical protein
MKTIYRIAGITLLAAITLIAAGCPQRRSIGEIEANPSRYNDKSVAIAGIVKTSYGVSIPVIREGGGIYKVDDGTGSIWVISQEGVPTRDTQVLVKGKIRNGVTYNGRNYGLVLMEDSRKFRRN